jgi:hypothetical protein
MKSFTRIIILHLSVLIVTLLFLIVNAMGLDRKSDVFPLDVWEEMENWNHNKNSVSASNRETNSRLTEVKIKKVEFVHTHFPFDVLKEINALDGTRLKNNKSIKMNQVKPYWIPDELIAR